MMRRLLLLLVLLPWLVPAVSRAQSVPIKRGVITVDSAPSGDCSAVPGQVRRVRSTGETYVCEGGSWYRRDLPPCDPDPPSGSCSGNAVCLSESEASLYLCAGGSWQQVTGGGGGSGDMEKSTYDTDDDGVVDSSESLKGNPVNVDADADGTTDLVMHYLASPGTTHEALAIDSDNDGTSDLWVSKEGLLSRDGRLLSWHIPLFYIESDNHQFDASDTTIDACDDNGIRCTINIVRRPSSTVPTDAVLRDWASRHEIASHGSYHSHTCAYNTSEGSAVYNESTDWGKITSGTVSVTNGSTTVTGSGTTWLNDHTKAARGMVLLIDSDGDGSYDDETWHYVDSVQSDNELTMASPWEGATGSGLSYVIWPNFESCLFELMDSAAELENDIGENYQVKTFATPGSFGRPGDAYTAAMATAANYDGGSTYQEEYSYTQKFFNSPGRFRSPWMVYEYELNCGDDAENGVNPLIDTLAEEGGILGLQVHDVKTDPSCDGTSTSPNTNREEFDAFISHAKSLEAQGKLLIVTKDEAIRISQVWYSSDTPVGVNVISNVKFRHYSGLVNSSRHYAPWVASIDADATVSSAEGELSITHPNTSDTTRFIQPVNLTPGWYLMGVTIEVDGVSGTGAFIALESKEARGTASDTRSETANVLSPVWYREDQYDQNNPDFFWHRNAAIRVDGPYLNGTKRATIYGYFYVDEVAAVYPLRMYLRFSGSGTAKFSHPFLVRVHPFNEGLTPYGVGRGLHKYLLSRKDPSDTGDQFDAAFVNVWAPHGDQRANTPEVDLFGWWYWNGDAELSTPLMKGRISAKDTMDLLVSGDIQLGSGDAPTAGTCLRESSSAALEIDVACDGTHDDNDGCITGIGTDSDCDGTEETRFVEQWYKLNIQPGQSGYNMAVSFTGGPYYLYVPRDATVRELRCYATETLNAGTVTAAVSVYNNYAANFDHDTGLEVTIDSSFERAQMATDATCINCSASAGQYLRVKYTTSSDYQDDGSDNTADLICELVFDQDAR